MVAHVGHVDRLSVGLGAGSALDGALQAADDAALQDQEEDEEGEVEGEGQAGDEAEEVFGRGFEEQAFEHQAEVGLPQQHGVNGEREASVADEKGSGFKAEELDRCHLSGNTISLASLLRPFELLVKFYS